MYVNQGNQDIQLGCYSYVGGGREWILDVRDITFSLYLGSRRTPCVGGRVALHLHCVLFYALHWNL